MSYRREVIDTRHCSAEGCGAVVARKHQHPIDAPSLIPDVTPIGWSAIVRNISGFEVTDHYCPAHPTGVAYFGGVIK